MPFPKSLFEQRLLTRRKLLLLGGSAAASCIAPIWPPLATAASVGSAKPGTYLNPVIAGDHPDAGAIRVGKDYYLVHTTDNYTPGLLIWHSLDLVHWETAGAALDMYYGAVWAPFLCEYKGRFYIYYPCDGVISVVHAASPLGPWSKPVSLGLHGIDPTHGATPEGRRVLHMAGGWMAELASDGLSATSPLRKVLQPWPIPEEWQVECECLEAPKLLYRDGYYYLNVAEGGTSGPPTSHMVLSARSRNIDGPWEWSPFNPVVHTYSRTEKWWSKGHGRLVDAEDGSWWMTLHSYENGFSTLGRQILLLPVVWEANGWYRVPEGISAGEPIPKAYLKPVASAQPAAAEAVTSNSVLSGPVTTGQAGAGQFATGAAGGGSAGAFTGQTLDVQWQFWRGYDPSRFRLSDGALILSAHGDSISTTSVLTRAATDHSYTVEVEVETTPSCEAGLLLFYDSQHSCGLRVSADAHLKSEPKTNVVAARRATLRIVNDEQDVDFFYRIEFYRIEAAGGSASGHADPNASKVMNRSADKDASGADRWIHIRDTLDVRSYQQNALGGFLDLRPALYACGTGAATFRNWRYTPQALRAV